MKIKYFMKFYSNSKPLFTKINKSRQEGVVGAGWNTLSHCRSMSSNCRWAGTSLGSTEKGQEKSVISFSIVAKSLKRC